MLNLFIYKENDVQMADALRLLSEQIDLKVNINSL